jgi:quercetin dioxygenase-like cupin family protein
MKLAPITRNCALILCGTVAGAAVVAALDRTALAQQDGIRRTILQRADVPGNPKYEAVMAISELAPGAVAAKHRHYGIELGYVLEGTVVIEQDGRPPVTFKVGDPIKNEAPHSARNAGPTPVKTLAVYIVEKDKPLSEPVK